MGDTSENVGSDLDAPVVRVGAGAPVGFGVARSCPGRVWAAGAGGVGCPLVPPSGVGWCPRPVWAARSCPGRVWATRWCPVRCGLPARGFSRRDSFFSGPGVRYDAFLAPRTRNGTEKFRWAEPCRRAAPRGTARSKSAVPDGSFGSHRAVSGFAPTGRPPISRWAAKAALGPRPAETPATSTAGSLLLDLGRTPLNLMISRSA